MKGMIMQAESVRAILDGRKSQTRRVMKVPPAVIDGCLMHHMGGSKWQSGLPYISPYGVAGSRVYVKEAIIVHASIPQVHGYVADGAAATEHWQAKRSAMYCPRYASRITLELTAVRAQRLQDITPIDAIDEGVMTLNEEWIAQFFREYSVDLRRWQSTSKLLAPPLGPGPVQRYRALWDHLNPKAQWTTNPWVWAYTFKRVQA